MTSGGPVVDYAAARDMIVAELLHRAQKQFATTLAVRYCFFFLNFGAQQSDHAHAGQRKLY